MSIENIKTEFAPTNRDRRYGSAPDTQGRLREPQTDPLSLQVEDDAGGDPYNRTGQHCLADLKKRQS